MQKFNPKQYLAIAIANHAGHDKLTWEERIDWVKNNINDLEDISDNPLYLKAVAALRAVNRGESVNYIMDLDATSSGYQIMSALSDCESGCLTTNLIDSGKRQDIYSKIAQLIPGMDRETIKKPVMTVGYGSTLKPKELLGEDTKEYQMFYMAMYRLLPGAMQLMSELRLCWDEDKTHHSWVLPDGHKVILPSTEVIDTRIESDELGTSYTFRHEVVKPHNNGTNIIANIIHSLDAYIAREMVRRLHRMGITVAHIHDSFWFSPVYGNEVRECYNNIMADMVSANPLVEIFKELTGLKYSFTGHLAPKIRLANYSIS